MRAGVVRISLLINIHEGPSISHFNESKSMSNEQREIDPKINEIQTLFVPVLHSNRCSHIFVCSLLCCVVLTVST